MQKIAPSANVRFRYGRGIDFAGAQVKLVATAGEPVADGGVRGNPMLWRLLLAIVLLVVVVGGIVGFNLFRDRMIAGFFAGMQPPPVVVSVIEAEPITWTPGIEAIGTASALRGVDLGVEAGGIVQEIHFRANDRVKTGQQLVQIDDRQERANVEAAQAQLDLSRETTGARREPARARRHLGLRARHRPRRRYQRRGGAGAP